jgi:hypothetical protein
MKVHSNGFKAARDRAVLINSYHVMTKDFRIPKARRLDDAALARLSNDMLFKLNSDLYSQATVKQAKRLAIKMGLLESRAGRIIRLVRSWFTIPKEAALA